MATATARLAIIGSGKMAGVQAANIASLPDAELVAIAGGSNAPALAERHGARSLSVDEVFADPDIDGVLVASPNRFHVEHILGAAVGGKAVLVEKPIDLELDRVDACIREVGDAASRIILAFQRRFDPTLLAVRKRVEAGEVGELEQLIIVSRDPAPPPLAYVPESGGIFRDMAIHDFDLARQFAGEIAAVTASVQFLDPELTALGEPSGAMITLESRAGALITIVDSRHNTGGYDQRLEAFGPKGAVAMRNDHLAGVGAWSEVGPPVAAGASDGGGEVPFYVHRYGGAYLAEASHLAAVARGEAKPISTLHDGREALVLALAAAESVATGRRVEL